MLLNLLSPRVVLILVAGALAGSTAEALPRTSDADTRTVVHTEAYKRRDDLGPHLEIKVTPPEGRGRKGYVLVEVYNDSKANLTGADFWLNMSNAWGDRVDAHITCDGIRGGLSALKWIKIPGNKPLPKITSISVKNMSMFTDQARTLKMRYTTDLIKR